MAHTKDAVVHRNIVDQTFRLALDADFMAWVSREIAELEPHLAWAMSAYEHTAVGAIADFRGNLSRKDVTATVYELRNMACLVYRCLTSGYREQLAKELEGLEVNDA